MKGEAEIDSKRISGKAVSISRRSILVFAFFLILSFIFWYLNALGKELEADLKYPVSFINLPKDRIFTEQVPSKINLNIKGPGFSIFKLKHSGNFVPLLIDISKINYKRIQGSPGSDYYLVTSGLIKNFTTQMRTECKIISIKPDTIFFSLEKSVLK